MRSFSKISFEQFKKDIGDDLELYNSFSLPKRQTKHSAGYDFYSLIDITIKPGETVTFPTGVKACFNENETLFLIIRSSLGYKYNLRLVNQVGVIDADYYNNEKNEGHMFVKIKNEGTEDVTFNKGDRIVQGIFLKYLTVDDEEDILNDRIGGTGSTN